MKKPRILGYYPNYLLHVTLCSLIIELVVILFFRDTILAALMTDTLGGNCYTNCLTLFKPIKTPASSIIMRYALRMKRIINYPTQNSLELKVTRISCEIILFAEISLFYAQSPV